MLPLAGLYLAWFAVINGAGARSAQGKADCLLVPGAKVEADGRPGPSLRARLDHAARLFHEGRAPRVVCTGGKGESGPIEAEAARDYLIGQGVPPEAFLLEGMSHTTWENFVFASQEMRPQGIRSCLVVTDPFHMQRCLWMARELGLEALPAPSFEGPAWGPRGMLFYTSREMAAWLKYGADRAGRAWQGS